MKEVQLMREQLNEIIKFQKRAAREPSPPPRYTEPSRPIPTATVRNESPSAPRTLNSIFASLRQDL